MNRSIFRTAQILLVVCVAVAGINAQRSIPAADKYKISAKAGLINYSEGLTSVTRLNGTVGSLIIGDQLNAGDRAITSAGGMAEVLLNPGSYLRLGSESEFSFRVTSLDDLRLDVRRGSAILEVFASNQFRVTAYTPKSRVTIVNTGVYRIDVASDGTGMLSVIEGKAIVGERNVALIKEGKTGTLDGGVVTIGKFDKGKRDTLASWSRTSSGPTSPPTDPASRPARTRRSRTSAGTSISPSRPPSRAPRSRRSCSSPPARAIASSAPARS